MTIFGFNTDVTHGDVMYHVQSEAQPNDLLFQTLVFVKGQCVGKHAVSYAKKFLQPGFSTHAMHELLKHQHKTVIEAIQHGKMDSIGVDAGIQDVGGCGLSLKWNNAAERVHGHSLRMHLQVTDFGHLVAGAEIVCHACTSPDGPPMAKGVTDAHGMSDIHVPLNEQALHDSALIVEARHGGKAATRKFRFRRHG
ncbi:MAG TPA: hypothetical protein VEW69_05475 [Alphaproteobacteria bacterium]|nr:hypothetical protein [Alphaproteobacteria bacterium]